MSHRSGVRPGPDLCVVLLLLEHHQRRRSSATLALFSSHFLFWLFSLVVSSYFHFFSFYHLLPGSLSSGSPLLSSSRRCWITTLPVLHDERWYNILVLLLQKSTKYFFQLRLEATSQAAPHPFSTYRDICHVTSPAGNKYKKISHVPRPGSWAPLLPPFPLHVPPCALRLLRKSFLHQVILCLLNLVCSSPS